jgi:uncharacterized repeat protein (TIGR03803 family)
VPYVRSAPKYKVLHAFGNGKDGAALWGSLLLDREGNVYGTTYAGGAKQGGTVFELTPQARGNWKETILHSFDGNQGPSGPICGLLFDSAGNLYGATTSGVPYTYGSVYKMSLTANGWKLSVIHGFERNDQADGPHGNVVMDQEGNLYGVGGNAFQLSPGPQGWKESLLHTFDCQHGDGCGALAGPILDPAGNLYGTTEHGGSSKNCGGGCGIAYRLTPLSGGTWKETILHSFGAPGDGAFPGVGALTLDQAGNVYGTTDVGGPAGDGTVFRLTEQPNGHWKETILHSFPQGRDGDHVSAGVVFDRAGNLYGTTISGGGLCGCGVVYKLAPQANGKWKYTVLHRFTGGNDGDQPDANLIVDDKGNLYGTTPIGGRYGSGVVFEVTP